MLKVLLIDDQPRELAGIQKILNWNDMGMDIIGTAGNGREGLQLVEELMPDLVLTDVIMPDMDGLSFVQTLHDKFPEIRVICISCFDDFKFVSMAVNYGASGYVLKPILARELQDVVSRVAADIFAQKRQQQFLYRFQGFAEKPNLLKEALGLRLLQGGLSQKETTLLLKAADWEDLFMVCCFGNIESVRDLSCHLAVEVACIEQNGTIATCFIPVSSFDQEQSIIQGLQDAVRSLSRETKRQALAGVSRSICASQIPKAVLDAQNALQYAAQEPDGIGRCGTDDLPQISPFYFSARMRGRWKELIMRQDLDMAESFLNRILPESPIRELRKVSIYLYLLLAEECRWERDEWPEKLYQQLQEVYRKEQVVFLFREAFQLLFEGPGEENEGNKRLIRQIKDYIQEHLTENIQIQHLAKVFYISSGYANIIFKNETGMTIHQYIVYAHMKAAARLLRDKPDLKIYDVAAEVGYTDVAYFINVFKKTFGCTPSQYKMREEKLPE